MDAKVSTKTKTKMFQNLNKNCPSVKGIPWKPFSCSFVVATNEKDEIKFCKLDGMIVSENKEQRGENSDIFYLG